MMTDYISRQVAIDLLKKAYWNNDIQSAKDDPCIVDAVIDWAIRQVKSLPPSQPKQKWIPCSERLPEYGVSVLTYDGYCFCVEKRIPTVRGEMGEAISSDWWVSDDYDESYDYYPNLRDGACIAWMPLPEPYKEATE